MEQITPDKKISLQMVLDQLKQENLAPADADAKIQTYIESKPDVPNPWYIQVMVGFSAWLAAIFFLIFLIGVFRIEEKSFLVLGLLFCAAACFLKRMPKDVDLFVIFLNQLALIANVTGQVFILIWVGCTFRDETPICLAAIILQLIMLLVYPDKIQRFATPVVIISAIIPILQELSIQFSMHFFIVAVAAGTLAVWLFLFQPFFIKWADYAHPIAYGLILSFLHLLLVSVGEGYEYDRMFKGLVGGCWWPTTVGLMLCFWVLIAHIFRFYKQPLEKLFLIVLLASGVLAWITRESPGILGSIFILVLGFYRSTKLVQALTIIFLAIFVIHYYYFMDVTLLTKSFILMGVAVLLFMTRAFLVCKCCCTKEEKPCI